MVSIKNVGIGLNVYKHVIAGKR